MRQQDQQNVPVITTMQKHTLKVLLSSSLPPPPPPSSWTADNKMLSVRLLFAAECKYQFQAWGECDLNTALKTRTGNLKRALHNADCQKTVTISKPCGKLTKAKPQGNAHWKTIVSGPLPRLHLRRRTQN